jgi:putative hemolysin
LLQRAKLQHQVNAKVKGADRVLKLVKKPEKLLSTVLLGNNFAQNAAVALATALAIHFIGNEQQGVIIATIGITVITFCKFYLMYNGAD